MRDLLRQLRRWLDFFYTPRLRWPMPEELYPDRTPGDVAIGDPVGDHVCFDGELWAGEVRGA